MSGLIQRETSAYDAFSKWMKDADQVRQLFAEAGLPLPPRLSQFFGEEARSGETRIIIPPPPQPRRPVGMDPTWIWVPMAGLMTKNLTLGTLRNKGVPMTPGAIAEEAKHLGGIVTNEGSIQNLGKRLAEDGTIARTDAGWILKKDGRAPVVVDGYAWGPIDLFHLQEVAAHRRELIIHVLGLHSSGLQQAQLLATLEQCSWRNEVPVAKDLIKLDIEMLQKAGRVRRVGASSKWEVMPV